MSSGEPSSNNDTSDSDSANADGDVSSSDGDDPFSFQTHKFTKKRQECFSESEDDDSSDDDSVSQGKKPSRTGRNRRKGGLSVDERLSALQNRKRPKVTALDDDASDDSDFEIVGEKPAPPAKAPKQQEIELLSSDDDDDLQPNRSGVPSYTSANLEGVKAIQKAREARRALVRAQHYHGEDIRVAVPPPQHLPPNPMLAALNYEQISSTYASMQPMMNGTHGAILNAAAFQSMPQNMLYPTQQTVMPGGLGSGATMPTSNKKLGKSLLLTLRAQEFLNGHPTTTSGTSSVFPIKEHETLQHLLDKYLKARNVSPTSTTVIFKFDGRQLDMNKTPASYEMEDEDMIDVTAKTIAIPTTSSKPAASSATFGTELFLTLRVHNESSGGTNSESVVQDVLSIRLLEPLRVLLEKFKKKRRISGNERIKMTFDGLKLDMNKSPKDYDIEDEDLIDVQVKS